MTINVQFIQYPVVQLAINFKFQRTNGVCNPFNGIRKTVRKVVHGINTPLIARPVMWHPSNAIESRITHNHIRRCHINLGSQYMCAVLEFSSPHALEQIQVFFGRTCAIGALLARLSQSASVLSDFLGAQAANIGLTFFDQLDGILIQLLKVVRCIKQPITPIESKPSNVFFDRFHIFNFLLAWIGIIEA